MNINDSTVVARFSDDAPARLAVDALQDSGFPLRNIDVSIDCSNIQTADSELSRPSVFEGALSGAVHGALLGLVFGLILACGAYVMSTAGSQMILEVIGIACLSLSLGGVGGGVLGAVLAARINRSGYSETEISQSNTVVAVKAGDRVPDAKLVLIQSGGAIEPNLSHA